MIITKGGIPIALKSARVVSGGRGDYVEIAPEDILLANLFIPEDQKWRISEDWIDKVYYVWHSTKDEVKVYFQKKLVDYADYKLGFYYVSPDLVDEVPDE